MFIINSVFTILYIISFLLGLFGLFKDAISDISKRDLLPERVASTQWMSIQEVPRFYTALVKVFDMKRAFPKGVFHLNKVLGIIMKMWRLSGITFTIQYFSEVLRLVVQFLDMKAKTLKASSPWVKTHKGKKKLTNMVGLPSVLPFRLKQKLVQVRRDMYVGSLRRTDLLWLKVLLSLLAFFRCTSPKYSPTKIETITGKFTGHCEVLNEEDIRKALHSMGWGNQSLLSQIRGKASIWRFATKSGPNSSLGILGAGIDLVGFIHRPEKWLQYFLMSYRCRFWSVLTFFVLCSVLCLPLAILFKRRGDFIYLGRLAVLSEARGKRRIIGITDWWTQVLLMPLHDTIYKFLGTIPQDGTKDQVAPIKKLLELLGVTNIEHSGTKRLQSMDLSAATDRLPVKLQAQILQIMGFDGKLWMEILDREWLFEQTTVRYEVGQPMGAYSSFASLALTHHVIIRIAALQSGVDPKKLLYAVLGDDGAMANRKVAKQYKLIFNLLGMTINPIKGFDGTVLEFAKQLWTLNRYNISPLGAKNILLFIRNVEFLPSILYELLVKYFPLFVKYGPSELEILPLGWGSEFKRRRPKPLHKSGYTNKRNYKRSASNQTGFPLVTVDSLTRLISSLFFQKRIKVHGNYVTVSREKLEGDMKDWSWLKVRLRVLNAIGPRSGLWYLPMSIHSYIFCGFMDGFWRGQFTTALLSWKLTKLSSDDILMWVKNYDEKGSLITRFVKDICDTYKLLKESLLIPITYLPVFSDESPRYNHLHSAWIGYLVVFSPAYPNLMKNVWDSLRKSVITAWLLTRMCFLNCIYYWSKHGILVESIIAILSIHFMIGSDFYTIQWSIIMWCLHRLLYSEYVQKWSSYKLFRTHGYAKWPGYDPGESIVTTLSKVVDKKKLEDSGGFRQLLSLIHDNPTIVAYKKRLIPLKDKSEGNRETVKTVKKKSLPVKRVKGDVKTS